MRLQSVHHRGKIVYFSHGGGLLPILGDASHQAMVDFMQQLTMKLIKPEAILVIGSGFSFHNLRAFFRQDFHAPDPANEAFQDWLVNVCTSPMDQVKREKRLIDWEKAPNAR